MKAGLRKDPAFFINFRSHSQCTEMSKTTLYPLLVLLSSFFLYFEWGTEQQSFLWQMELELFQKLGSNPGSLLHPLIFLPLLGQILLIYCALRPKASRIARISAIVLIASLVFFVALGGIMAGNYKMVLSILPFIILSILWLKRSASSKSQA